jgi:hypothetical protein
VWRAAGGAILVVVLAGCGGDPAATSAGALTPAEHPAPTSSAATLPDVPGISAEAVRLRTDEAIGGQVQVRITATGTTPFTVTSVQLDSPGFEVLPAKAFSTGFGPGQVIDLPTAFGAVDRSVAVDPVAARVTVVRPDGTAKELRVPLSGGTMAQVHEEECAVEGVLAVVDVAVGAFAGSGETLGADVVLTRRSGDDVAVVSALLPSVVLEPVPDEDLPVRMAAGDQRLRLPVAFAAQRCDPHALAETKQPFLFPMIVTVGDGDDVAVPLPLDDAQRVALQEFLGRVCR